MVLKHIKRRLPLSPSEMAQLRTALRLGIIGLAVACAIAPSGSTARADNAAAGTMQEMRRQLDQRDAAIRALMRRVDDLERRARPPRKLAKTVLPLPGPPPPKPAPPADRQRHAATAAKPGKFEVDQDAAEHALERALIQSGALLLTTGTIEIVPSIAYVRRESAAPGQLVFPAGGGVMVSDNQYRQNQIEASILARAGLPWQMQIELGLPYDFKSVSDVTMVGTAGLSQQTTRAWGFGDPSLVLSKQFTREGEWLPSLIGSLGWDTDFGETKNGIALGSGFNEIKASVVASKRQDPLVFTASLGYTTSLSKHGIQPGDQYTASGGMFLAVSPETSLLFQPQVTFAGETSFEGMTVPGSDQVAAALELGLVTVLAPKLLLDLRFDIGLTHDAPKFGMKVSFPFRRTLGG